MWPLFLIFINNNSKGLIVDKKYSISLSENIHYQLLIAYGDRTLGKSISTNNDNVFPLQLKNFDIYSVLASLNDWLKQGCSWRYEGDLPDNEFFNVTIRSDSKLVFPRL